MPIEIPTIQPRVIPVTAEAIADAPDQPLEDGVNSNAELSTFVTIKARKPGTANDNEEERDARHS